MKGEEPKRGEEWTHLKGKDGKFRKVRIPHGFRVKLGGIADGDDWYWRSQEEAWVKIQSSIDLMYGAECPQPPHGCVITKEWNP